MRIAVIFASLMVTDKDEQLVRAIAALPIVTEVVVSADKSSSTALSRLERLRAIVEGRVSGAPTAVRDARTLFGEKIRIGATGVIGKSVSLENEEIDRVVNLSGQPFQPNAGSHCEVLELWFDGVRALSLGTQRASGKPASNIVVSVSSGARELAVAERSVLTLTPETPAGDRRNAASRAIVLILRALGQSEIARFDAWTAKESSSASSITAIASTLGTITSAILRRASRTLARRDAWEIRYRTNPCDFVANSNTFTTSGFKKYRSDYNRFVADPIVFQHNGIDALFFEEYPHDTRRGVISCAVLNSDGTLGASKVVLERPYHLSYPFVFQSGDDILMIPETSANKAVELYRCTRFPHEWIYEKTLMSDISITDATVHFDGRSWWMFATVGAEGSYAWDELHLFMADSPTGEWTAHQNNPVKRDPRTARPAGPLFKRDGRLIRPTQDCSITYGGAVALCEVKTLTPTAFEEQEVARLAPERFGDAVGLHTLSASSRLEVIDLRPKLRWRWEK